jgi:hypothetical protein
LSTLVVLPPTSRIADVNARAEPPMRADLMLFPAKFHTIMSHPNQYTGSYEYEYKYTKEHVRHEYPIGLAVTTDLNDSDTIQNIIYLNEKHTNGI